MLKQFILSLGLSTVLHMIQEVSTTDLHPTYITFLPLSFLVLTHSFDTVLNNTCIKQDTYILFCITYPSIYLYTHNIPIILYSAHAFGLRRNKSHSITGYFIVSDTCGYLHQVPILKSTLKQVHLKLNEKREISFLEKYNCSLDYKL